MKLEEKKIPNEYPPFVDESLVNEVFNEIDIDNISIQELYDRYLKYKELYDDCIESLKKKHCDIVYHDILIKRETYQYLYEFMAQQCINKVNPNDCEIGALRSEAKRLVKLYENIDRTIDDLEIYKPTNYKKMIELLHNLTRH